MLIILQKVILLFIKRSMPENIRRGVRVKRLRIGLERMLKIEEKHTIILCF